ncbi:MAG: type II toxin-antitoxin system PemK/MazF family toxin [Candidatus Dependentiae bacterium]
MVKQFPKRGDIFWVKLDPTLGSEINKTRPAVIVSNDLQNEYSNIVIIAPLTSNIKRKLPFHVSIEVEGKEGRILIDQVRAIDKRRLAKQMAICELQTMIAIDKALKLVFNLI